MENEGKALTTKSADFGRAVIEAAQSRENEKKKSQVLDYVTSLFESREQTTELITLHTKRLDLLNQRIAAIEAGEFVIANSGAVAFKDEKLQDVPVDVRRCPACGSTAHALCDILGNAIR